MIPLWEMIGMAVFGVANWSFAIAWVIRKRCVQGSRLRYSLATLQWTVVPLVAIQPLWYALTGDPIWIQIMCMIGNYFGIWVLWHDDDDNWWKRKKKKLRTWVQNLSRKPVTVGVKA